MSLKVALKTLKIVLVTIAFFAFQSNLFYCFAEEYVTFPDSASQENGYLLCKNEKPLTPNFDNVWIRPPTKVDGDPWNDNENIPSYSDWLCVGSSFLHDTQVYDFELNKEAISGTENIKDSLKTASVILETIENVYNVRKPCQSSGLDVSVDFGTLPETINWCQEQNSFDNSGWRCFEDLTYGFSEDIDTIMFSLKDNCKELYNSSSDLKKDGYTLIRTQRYQREGPKKLLNPGDEYQEEYDKTVGTQVTTESSTTETTGFSFGTVDSFGTNASIGFSGDFLSGNLGFSTDHTTSEDVSRGLSIEHYESEVNSELDTHKIITTYTGQETGAVYVPWSIVDEINLVRNSDNTEVSKERIYHDNVLNKYYMPE